MFKLIITVCVCCSYIVNCFNRVLFTNVYSTHALQQKSQLGSVISRKWETDNGTYSGSNHIGNDDDDSDDDQLLINNNEPTWLQMFPQTLSGRSTATNKKIAQSNPYIHRIERDMPDFASLAVDDPLWLDMEWPQRAGPEATAYSKHLQWKRKLSDGERLRWQKWAVYHRLMDRNNYDYSIDDYIYQSMLNDFTKQAVKSSSNNKVDAGLWLAVPLSMKMDEELEVSAVMKAFYSAFNRKNFDSIRSLWLPDSNVEITLPGYGRVRGYGEVDKIFKILIKDSKPFGSIDHKIVSVKSIGYVTIVQTVETIKQGTALKGVKRIKKSDAVPTLSSQSQQQQLLQQPKLMLATTILRKWNKQWRIMSHHVAKFKSSPYTDDPLSVKQAKTNRRKLDSNSISSSISSSSSIASKRKKDKLLSSSAEELQALIKERGSELSSVSRVKKDGSVEKVVLLGNDITPDTNSQISSAHATEQQILQRLFGTSSTKSSSGSTSSSSNATLQKIKSKKTDISNGLNEIEIKFVTMCLIALGETPTTAATSKITSVYLTLVALRYVYMKGKISRKTKTMLLLNLIETVASNDSSISSSGNSSSTGSSSMKTSLPEVIFDLFLHRPHLLYGANVMDTTYDHDTNDLDIDAITDAFAVHCELAADQLIK